MGRPGRSKAIATALAAAVVVAILGGLATDIGPWYASLRKPSWQPPDAAFGPAWTIIYGFTVVAGVRVWERTRDRGSREWIVVLFALNAFLNVSWSLLFFRLHRPDWALLEVGVFWSSILALVIVAGRRDRMSGLLLAPYLAWVAFASYLNLTIVELNAPFAGR